MAQRRLGPRPAVPPRLAVRGTVALSAWTIFLTPSPRLRPTHAPLTGSLAARTPFAPRAMRVNNIATPTPPLAPSTDALCAERRALSGSAGPDRKPYSTACRTRTYAVPPRPLCSHPRPQAGPSGPLLPPPPPEAHPPSPVSELTRDSALGCSLFFASLTLARAPVRRSIDPSPPRALSVSVASVYELVF